METFGVESAPKIVILKPDGGETVMFEKKISHHKLLNFQRSCTERSRACSGKPKIRDVVFLQCKTHVKIYAALMKRLWQKVHYVSSGLNER